MAFHEIGKLRPYGEHGGVPILSALRAIFILIPKAFLGGIHLVGNMV